jgi:hypothetical protein
MAGRRKERRGEETGQWQWQGRQASCVQPSPGTGVDWLVVVSAPSQSPLLFCRFLACLYHVFVCHHFMDGWNRRACRLPDSSSFFTTRKGLVTLSRPCAMCLLTALPFLSHHIRAPLQFAFVPC